MTADEQIQQLTTNLKASLALNNITRARAAQAQKKKPVTGFFTRLRKSLGIV